MTFVKLKYFCRKEASKRVLALVKREREEEEEINFGH
jgi:hypothetical protein